MIVAVGNTKGGVGKTTIAVQLAVLRAIDNKSVWLIDADRQATASSAIGARMQSEKKPGIACSQYVDGQQLRAQLLQQKENFDDVVIDVGGRDSTALRAALILADVLIVPFAPRTYDVWALDDMADLVKEARSVRDNLKVYAVMNQADALSSSTDNADAAEAVKAVEGFEYVDLALKRRKSIANAAGQGLAVSEMKDKDAKAIEEVSALYKFIFNTK